MPAPTQRVAASGPPDSRANATYYFRVGAGVWKGTFRFTIVRWSHLWRDHIGFINRALAIGMFLVIRIAGPGRIDSRIRAFPDRGKAGMATNVVRISRWGVTLYLLREQYILDANGRDVWVRSRERFGPI